VVVETPDDVCMPARYDQPFVVAGPDMTPVQYTPAEPQYFDQVLLDLSRAFTIGEVDSVSRASEGIILRLLAEHVFRPMRKERAEEYATTPVRYPAVQRYHEEYYPVEAAGPTEASTDTARVVQSEGSTVAA
jgi:hypothetical protein